MAEGQGGKGRSWLWRLRLVGSLLSAVLLAVLIARQDWRAILEALGALPSWTVAAALALLALRHFWNTLRWLILVRAQGIPFNYGQALRLVFAGLFASNFLPGMVGGDMVRMTGLAARSPKRVAAAASVVMDRAVGVAGMALLSPFGLPLLRGLLSSGWALGAAGAGLPQRWLVPLHRGLRQLGEALRLWLGQPLALAGALLASLLAVFTFLLGVWILALGLGIPVSLADVTGASVLTYFLTLIPFSINGYGLRELALLTFYTQLGATAEQATALAFITRAMFLLISLPGTLWVGAVLPAAGRAEAEKKEEVC